MGESAMPMSGEIVPFDVDETDVCSVQSAYTSYLVEAELERLNMSRRPGDTRDARLASVTDRLNAGTEFTLDGAGRLTIDGLTLDAGPDHAAMYWSLMTTGTVPGLGAAPAMVQGFDPWMLAAASLGTAAGKEIPIIVDTVQYYNRIIGLIQDHNPTPQWSLDFLETSPSTGEKFVDFSEFSYQRSSVFIGCATWLDVPTLTWKVATVAELAEFAPLPPNARDTNSDGIADTLDNLAGFTQLADDVRSVVLYVHENDTNVGFYIDPVGTNTCDEQQAALIKPVVSLEAAEMTVIQAETTTLSVSTFLPAGADPISNAVLEFTIEATTPGQAFTSVDQVEMTPAVGSPFGVTEPFVLDNGALKLTWGGTDGFPLAPNTQLSTDIDLVVAAGAPIGNYRITVSLVDLKSLVSSTDDTEVSRDSIDLDVRAAGLNTLWVSLPEAMPQVRYEEISMRLYRPSDVSVSALENTVMQVRLHAEQQFLREEQATLWTPAGVIDMDLTSGGDLLATIPLPDPLPTTTNWIFDADLAIGQGAPVGEYLLTVSLVDDSGAGAILTSDTKMVEVFAPGTLAAPVLARPALPLILTGPPVLNAPSSAQFIFTSDQIAATFTCALDTGPFEPCTSASTVSTLSDGLHRYWVKATGTNGAGALALWTWTVGTTSPPPPPPPPPPGGDGGVFPAGDLNQLRETLRIQDRDRIGTALQIALRDFRRLDGTGPIADRIQAKAAVLVSAYSYADALSGGPLAHAKDAPLLLTERNQLNTRVRAMLQTHLPTGATVYLVGGTAVLSGAIATELTALGYVPQRLAGANRYATAVAVARTGLGSPAQIFVTTGNDFADGLTAGVVAARLNGAVLLTNAEQIPAELATYLADHPGSTVVAVGGPAARAFPGRTAYQGQNRYATAVSLANAYAPTSEMVGVALGTNFPDALAAGPYLARRQSVLMLVQPDQVPVATRDYLRAQRTLMIEIFGGEAAINANTQLALASIT
jgi:hypothetical protein